MISCKNYLLLSLYFFTSFSLAQSIDISILDDLTPEQIEAAKELAIDERTADLDIEDSIIKDPIEIEESLKTKEEIEGTDTVSLKKFGYDFFSAMPTSLTAFGDLPLPNDYKISLKDQFRIILSGSRDQIFNLNVNLDGTILFPEYGSVYVAGLTFGEVKDKLSNIVNQIYIGVNIDISLQNLSAKKITIVGAVKTPGTYLINPFSTITGALAYSGGISEIGSLRDIRLIRNNGTTFSFDLYELLIRGDRSNDLTIEAGDTILINAASQFVEIRGSVNRPGIYEILEGEEIKDIIEFGLGFTQKANKSNISITLLDLEKASLTTKTKVSLDQSLNNVQVVDVFNYMNNAKKGIRVFGAVEEPGFYDLEKYNNLSDLINDLKFIDVYPWMAVLEQFDNENLVRSVDLFSLNDKSTYQSIELKPNSRLSFADYDERLFDEFVGELALKLINEYSLTLNYKTSIFSLPVVGKFSVSSFVDLLGLDMSDVDRQATYISPLDSKIIVDDYENMNFTASKYNNISFRAPINDLITVNVLGSVQYPGTYTLESRSTLKDLYALVGEFKDEAFLDGIVLTRETVRERQLRSIATSEDALNKSILYSIQQGQNVGDFSMLSAMSESIQPENLGRIAGNFSPFSQSSSETVLFDGDTLVIPKRSNVINIIGAVLNPIAFEFDDNLTIESAITKAGGYQPFADRKRLYVIKANGLVQKTARSIFSGNNDLAPGDTIVVPRKISTDSAVMKTLVPVMQILSDLSFSAAALDNLTDN